MDYVVLPDGSIENLSTYKSEIRIKSFKPVSSNNVKMNGSRKKKKRKSKKRGMLTQHSGAPIEPNMDASGAEHSMVQCPYCSSKVRSDRVDNHCTRVHGVTLNVPRDDHHEIEIIEIKKK